MPFETDAEMYARFRREAEAMKAFAEATSRGLDDGTVYAVSQTPVYDMFDCWYVALSNGWRVPFSPDPLDPDKPYRDALAFIAKYQPNWMVAGRAA